MSEPESHLPAIEPAHVIVGGYGIPGRAVSDLLARRQIPHTVIELNAHIVERCAGRPPIMIAGDIRDPRMLQEAGIERAGLLVLAVPDDATTLAAITAARNLRPHLPIIARCTFVSAGLRAVQHGAEEVVIAEEIMAVELSRLIEARLT